MNEFSVNQIIKYNGKICVINHIITQDNYFENGKTTWLYLTAYEYEKESISCTIKSTDSDITLPTKQEIELFRKPKEYLLLNELNEIKSLLQQILNK